ncbi:MAG: WD40 domain protein beta Propeller [Candidatus Amesbacteria bacterium GW2011_GWC1_47_15]|uniref:WD40 domain protein beta Propeller n=1 Tax=Candidatus Amesbacteria bacterium GW2011_GWC1_47_15 TaxID=1618364 RepID=A0A0G1S3X5_9BACT|nr:MAG: WD40 domain protein beta Propeller [Candidatus Amesbacteria bacterium GW2011_GWC1_47_15]
MAASGTEDRKEHGRKEEAGGCGGSGSAGYRSGAIIDLVDSATEKKARWILSLMAITAAAILIYLFSAMRFDKLKTPEILKIPKEKVLSGQDQVYKVERVIDGDTLKLESGQTVRLVGIDTPEITGKDECFGQEAAEKLKELVEGADVTLVKDISETDRYGRLLRYIKKDGEFINLKMVEEGYAAAATYPPDVKYSESFVEAQRIAREEKKGLWGVCGV